MIDVIVHALDVNALVQQVNLNALVDQVNIDKVLGKIDASSSGAASEALDAARSQAVGLDQFIDRWTGRLLRREGPGPTAPAALLDAQAGP